MWSLAMCVDLMSITTFFFEYNSNSYSFEFNFYFDSDLCEFVISFLVSTIIT